MSCTKINGYTYNWIGLKSKMAQDFMRRYAMHKDRWHLMQNYTTCSERKLAAWEEICSRLTEVRITGAGSSFFSCAGKLVDHDTGDEYFAIETPSYSYIVFGGSWKYFKENF